MSFIDDLIRPVEKIIEMLIEKGWIWLILAVLGIVTIYLMLKGVLFK